MVLVPVKAWRVEILGFVFKWDGVRLWICPGPTQEPIPVDDPVTVEEYGAALEQGPRLPEGGIDEVLEESVNPKPAGESGGSSSGVRVAAAGGLAVPDQRFEFDNESLELDSAVDDIQSGFPLA